MAVTRVTIVTPDAKEADQAALHEVANMPGGIQRLGEFIRKQIDGKSKIRLNTGAVQAEGAIAFSSFADADTVTINGVLLTGKTTPSDASQWAVGASDEACANNLYTKLKASTLDKIVGVVIPYRRGTVLLSSFADGDTITVNGVIFTGKTTPSATDPRQFAIGGTDAASAENLKNAIVACRDAIYFEALGAPLLSVTRSSATLTFNFDGVLTLAASAHATVSDKIVQIMSAIGGQLGNLMTLAISAHGSKTDPTGGTEGTETIFAQNRIIQ